MPGGKEEETEQAPTRLKRAEIAAAGAESREEDGRRSDDYRRRRDSRSDRSAFRGERCGRGTPSTTQATPRVEVATRPTPPFGGSASDGGALRRTR